MFITKLGTIISLDEVGEYREDEFLPIATFDKKELEEKLMILERNHNTGINVKKAINMGLILYKLKKIKNGKSIISDEHDSVSLSNF